MSNINTARHLAITGHHKQSRRSGEPYINHPLRVADMVEHVFYHDRSVKIVATLHDVIEDTAYTEETLRLLDFDDHIVNSVLLLTQPKSMSREIYIRNLLESTNRTALRVKLMDAIDNSTWSYSDRTTNNPELWVVKRKYYRELVERLIDRLLTLDGEDQALINLHRRIKYVWVQLDNLSLREFCRARSDHSRDHIFIGCTNPHAAIINDNQDWADSWDIDLFDGVSMGDFILPPVKKEVL